MKKAIIISTVLTIGMNTQSVFAQYTEAKQTGAFFTSSVAGAALGGPVGLIAGALGGVWLSEELKRADEADGYQRELTQVSDKVLELNARLLESNQMSEKYAQMAAKPFELQMLFKTNQSELSSSGSLRVSQIAKYLLDNSDVSIQLDGHADPRGNAKNNLLLSTARVNAIANELKQQGLDPERIVSYSHGANLSQASEGDYDAYALERVVRVKLYRDNDSKADKSLAGY